VALVRVLLVLAVVALLALIIAYFSTGQRSYLNWALRVFVATVLSGLVFFAVLIVDRLL
jgi:hypothetical protein